MLRQNYDFSSIHVPIPDPLASEIIHWGTTKLRDENIYMYDGTLGREDEIHATVLYGLHSESSQQTKELMQNEPPFVVKLGKLKVFSNDTRFDVVYIEAECDRLIELNKKLKKNVTYTTRYSRYEPHITIAYIKKDRGWKLYGASNFVGRDFECSYLIFSSKNGTKENVPMGQITK